MKHYPAIAALVILFSLAGSGQAAGRQAASDNKAEREVMQIDTERAEAYVHGDTAALDRILADDCTYVHPNGRVETKAEVITGFKAGDRKYLSIERDDVVARVYGNTVVLTGRNTIKAIYQGQNYTVQNRFMRVYVKQQGRWQLAAHQATNIAKQ